MRRIPLMAVAVLTMMIACQPSDKKEEGAEGMVNLVTLDPGHFHAALLQKSMYPDVDSVVHVYAEEGPDLRQHLSRIESFNTRKDHPTHWKEIVYTGPDFMEKMLADHAGNVVVLSGNNQKKTEYILKSLEGGFNVLADKPMVINEEDFASLKNAFTMAKDKKLLLYDIMTERFEITTLLQREFSMMPEIFGALEKGTPEHPAVTKESVHYFYKYVSGNVLTRPAWFMDVAQQGEGIVDVTTHLVDLVQWECFPEQSMDYTKDVQLTAARHWPTDMTLGQFTAITGLSNFPDYLKKNLVHDTVLQVYSNGEINFRLRDVHAKVSVIWSYRAPEGGGDTHYSVMRGTRANLIIRQGTEQQFKPVLYIEPQGTAPADSVMNYHMKLIQSKYPGVELKKLATGWEVVIPENYHEGHEAHFARVTKQFLEYLHKRNMPVWEVPNMLSKYYITTEALKLAKRK